MSTDEKYMTPKELEPALRSIGICRTADYIRAIRQECERRCDGTFVAGCARPSDLIKWMANNPRFTRRSARKKATAGFSV